MLSDKLVISLLNYYLGFLVPLKIQSEGFDSLAKVPLDEKVGCRLIELLAQLGIPSICIEALVENFCKELAGAHLNELLRLDAIAGACVNVVD